MNESENEHAECEYSRSPIAYIRNRAQNFMMVNQRSPNFIHQPSRYVCLSHHEDCHWLSQARQRQSSHVLTTTLAVLVT